MRLKLRLVLSIIVLGFGITTGGCDQTTICQVLEGLGVTCGSLNGNSNANDNTANGNTNDNAANNNTNDNTANGNTNDNTANNNANDNTANGNTNDNSSNDNK